MKNIFVEEMSNDEILFEEVLKDNLLLRQSIENQNDKAIEYYAKSLECDLTLMEEESNER